MMKPLTDRFHTRSRGLLSECVATEPLAQRTEAQCLAMARAVVKARRGMGEKT